MELSKLVKYFGDDRIRSSQRDSLIRVYFEVTFLYEKTLRKTPYKVCVKLRIPQLKKYEGGRQTQTAGETGTKNFKRTNHKQGDAIQSSQTENPSSFNC